MHIMIIRKPQSQRIHVKLSNFNPGVLIQVSEKDLEGGKVWGLQYILAQRLSVSPVRGFITC